MPEFTNLKDAFQWWIENVYPDLPSEDKLKLRLTKADFIRGKTISDNLIQKILGKYGDLELIVKYETK
jgi:hypothetical protein